MKLAVVRATLHKGSGQVTHIRELGQELAKLGCDITVFSREVHETPGTLKTVQIPFGLGAIPFLRNCGFALRAGYALRNSDIIHTMYHPGIFVGNVGRGLGHAAHVFTFHGFTPAAVWGNPRQRIKMTDHKLGTYFGLRWGIDHVIAVSEYLKEVLVNEYRYPPAKIQVIYNGIDTTKLHPQVDTRLVRDKYNLKTKPMILYLGRIAPYKGPQYLIKAAPKIMQEVPNVEIVIAGGGRFEVPRLKALAKKLGVNSMVNFPGYIDDALLPAIYNSCDIFCFPSLWEGFGMPPAEAMACEKPVVAFRNCAVPEVVKDGTTGILVAPRNHAELAEALITLLVDNKKRERMGRAGRKRVKQLFTWKRIAQQTYRVYEKVR